MLGSYAACLATHPELRSDFWGDIPAALRPVYTVSMLAAAVGYFPAFVLFASRTDPVDVRLGRFGFGAVNGLYAAILLPSALWMPLTLVMLESPGDGLWWAIRAVLVVVGMASIGVVVALVRMQPRPRGAAFATTGMAIFCFQTAVLDAVVWPLYFPH